MIPPTDDKSELRQLTVQVTRLVAQLEIWTPHLERQTTGLNDMTQRVTRVEDQLSALVAAQETRLKSFTVWISVASLGIAVLGHLWK